MKGRDRQKQRQEGRRRQGRETLRLGGLCPVGWGLAGRLNYKEQAQQPTGNSKASTDRTTQDTDGTQTHTDIHTHTLKPVLSPSRATEDFPQHETPFHTVVY